MQDVQTLVRAPSLAPAHCAGLIRRDLARSSKRVCTALNRLGTISGASKEEITELIEKVPRGCKRKQHDAESEVALVQRDPLIVPSEKLAPPKRSRNDQPLLSDVIQVVQYALSLGPGRPKQLLCRQKYPNILKTDVLSKWMKKYLKYQLWRMPLSVAERCRCVPNWYMDQIGLSCERRGSNTIGGLPVEVAKLVDKSQKEAVMGCTGASKRSDPVQGSKCLMATMKQAISKYEQDIQKLSEEIDVNNQQAWADFKMEAQNGDYSTTSLSTALRSLQKRVRKAPKLKRKIKVNTTSARRFQKKFGNFRCRTNTAGNYLHFMDPRMVASRHEHNLAVADNEVDTRLIL